ncbi:hypothetical protein ACN47E_009670 [Coniothyrium glycines]
MLTKFFNEIKAIVTGDSTDAHTHTNDATSPSPSGDLPPYPFAQGTPTVRGSSTDPIDLSESPRHHQPRARARARARDTRATAINNTAVKPEGLRETEKRLTGDYSLPADAVATPDPASWFMNVPSKAATMKPKPGAQNSLKPIDTLTSPHFPTPRSKSDRTYGKNGHIPRQTIGKAPHHGQLAYVEVQRDRTNASRARVSTNSKRIEHVNLVDDDDGGEPLRKNSPAIEYHKTTSSRRVFSGTSPQSQNSGGSEIMLKRQSEFSLVDAMLTPRRSAKHRRRGQGPDEIVRRGSQSGSCSASGHDRPTSKSSSNLAHDNNSHSVRKQLFSDFKQDNDLEPATSPRPHSATNLRHPKARVNESTAVSSPTDGRIASTSPRLHEQYRPAPDIAKISNGNDEADELAITHVNVATTKKKGLVRRSSPAESKAGKTTQMSFDSRKGFKLKYARTHGVKVTGNTVRLKIGKANEHQVFDQDSDNNFRWRFTIWLGKVNRVEADDIDRIRLLGGLRPEGGKYTYDLQFAKRNEFQLFRDLYVIPKIKDRAFVMKSTSYMENVFNGELEGDKKFEHPRPIPQVDQKIDSGQGQQAPLKVPSSSIIDQMKAYERSTTARNVQAANSKTVISSPTAPAPVRCSTRPTRAKANNTLYDVEQPSDSNPVPKFSQDVGLGKPWDRPLEYGEGRHRGTVQFDDLQRLDEEEYLNDSLIEYYMDYLFTKHKVPRDKVFFWNTYFYTALTSKTWGKPINYDAVTRWTAKVDIFDYDYIVVPVNDAYHWYLAIICNVKNIERKPVMENFGDEDQNEDPNKVVEELREDQPLLASTAETEDRMSSLNQQTEANGIPQEEDVNLFEEEKLHLVDRDETESIPITAQESATGILSQPPKSPKKKKALRKHVMPRRNPDEPVVIVLDSLNVTRGPCVRALKAWILAEGVRKRGMEAVIRENGYYPKTPLIPTQANFSDCGVYLLGYVDKFFQSPDTFKTQLLTGQMSAEVDWPDLQPKEMRDNMRNIIQKAAKDQDAARKAEKKARKGPIKAQTTSPTMSKASPEVLVEQPESRVSNELEAGDEDPARSALDKSGEKTEGAAMKPQLRSPFESPARAENPDIPDTSAIEVSGSTAFAQISTKPEPVVSTGSENSGGPSSEVSVHVQTMAIEAPEESVNSVEADGTELVSHDQDSTSPKKRLRPDVEDTEEAVPTKKRKSSATPWQERSAQNQSSTVTAVDTASKSKGHAASQPIEILDSQDVDGVIQRPPKRKRTQSPGRRDQSDSLKTRPRHHRRPTPSLEEILPLASKDSERKPAPRSPLVGHELEAELIEADQEIESARQLKSPTEDIPPTSLNRQDDEAFDLMEICTQEVDIMNLDESQADTVIRETPEAERQSPGRVKGDWIEGSALP